MKNRSFYIRVSVVFIVMFILSYVVSNIFVHPFLKDQNDLYHEISLYEQTTFDFLVPQPSLNQVDEFVNSNNYSEVVPFYMFNSNLIVGDETIDYNMILIEDFDDLGNTPYTKERMITEEELNQNSIIIDYSFSLLANIGIGDKIKINISNDNHIELVVSAIFEDNNSILGSAVVALFDGDLKDYILSSRSEDNPPTYHGAYLTAINEDLAWQELSVYQPLASLRTRDEFTSDLAYQTYLGLFNSTDYRTQIYNTNKDADENMDLVNDLSIQLQNQEITISLMIVISFVVLFLIIIVYTALDLKSRRSRISLIKEARVYTITILIASLSYILGLFVFGSQFNYISNYQRVHYSPSLIPSHLGISLFSMLIVIGVGIIVIYYFSKPNIDLSAKE
jgi:hypothetical protein